MKAVVDAAHTSIITVGSDASSITDVLEDFVRDAIKTTPESQQTCEGYCQEALQAILRASENGSAEIENLLRLFRVLVLFARVQPTIIARHAELLHQFLSSQNYESQDQAWSEQQSQLIGTVAAIYVHVLPVMTEIPAHLVKYLKTDLPKLVWGARNKQLLSTSIECVCTLVRTVGASPRKVSCCPLTLLCVSCDPLVLCRISSVLGTKLAKF